MIMNPDDSVHAVTGIRGMENLSAMTDRGRAHFSALVIFVLPAMLLASCSTVDVDLQDTLNESIRRWRNVGYQTYEYRLRVAGPSPATRYSPALVIVDGDSVYAVLDPVTRDPLVIQNSNGSPSSVLEGSVYTIFDLFDLIEHALDHDPSTVEAAYDDRLGYPEHVKIRGEAGRDTKELTIDVDHLVNLDDLPDVDRPTPDSTDGDDGGDSEDDIPGNPQYETTHEPEEFAVAFEAVRSYSDYSGASEIRALSPGGQPISLPGPTGIENPKWSPDGRWIAFQSSERSDVYVVRPDGTDLRNLTDDDCDDDLGGWSPDGTSIVYSRRCGTSSEWFTSARVVRYDVNAMSITQLTKDLPSDVPRWSTDGKHIAFRVFGRPGRGFEVWLMKADGSEQRPLFESGGHQYPLGWSPDGREVLFSIDRRGNRDLYRMDLDDTRPMRLTRADGFDGDATWSPDGRYIAFLSTRYGTYDLFVMNADGTGLRMLYRDVFDPSWSPDSRRIVMSRVDRIQSIDIDATAVNVVVSYQPNFRYSKPRYAAAAQ